MTLEQKVARLRLVADGLRRIQEFESARYLDEYATQLAQPAQSVGVAKVREVIAELQCVARLTDYDVFRDTCKCAADKLTAALQERGK